MADDETVQEIAINAAKILEIHGGKAFLTDVLRNSQAIASLLRINTSLVALYLGEDAHPHEGFVEIESVSTHHKFSLIDLTVRTREYQDIF
eukprot:scaffold2448_cov155-Amphora_coffeaeformis.AAC.3